MDERTGGWYVVSRSYDFTCLFLFVSQEHVAKNSNLPQTATCALVVKDRRRRQTIQWVCLQQTGEIYLGVRGFHWEVS